jgi:hypothetical protein
MTHSLRWNPRLRQPAIRNRSANKRAVLLVVLDPPVLIPRNPQRMGQMYPAPPASVITSAAQYQPQVASRTTSGAGPPFI